jgi:hypothetical protein
MTGPEVAERAAGKPQRFDTGMRSALERHTAVDPEAKPQQDRPRSRRARFQ